MNNEQIILLLLKLIVGFSASLTAVLLWSKTRQSSWLFIVMGTVTLYSETIFSVLDLFGLSNFYLLTVYGISLMKLIFAILPFLFFTVGFILFLLNRKGRF